MQAAKDSKLSHSIYAVAFKKGKSSLDFRIPTQEDFEGFTQAKDKIDFLINSGITEIPFEELPDGQDLDEQIRIFCPTWKDMFNPRQLLTLVTYVELINEAKELMRAEYELDRVEAIATYLALVCDRCVDKNCRLSHWQASRAFSQAASGQHALNLFWNYPEL